MVTHLLFFQESESDGEESDFSDLAYYLRGKLLPLSPDDSNLSNSQMAQAVQTLLDEQIDELEKSGRMKKFLVGQKDWLPCSNDNRIHTRPVLEILLTHLKISGKVLECHGKDIVTFKIIKGSCLPRCFSKPKQVLSQLSFDEDMLGINTSLHYSL